LGFFIAEIDKNQKLGRKSGIARGAILLKH
jgi:hypothetical protein